MKGGEGGDWQEEVMMIWWETEEDGELTVNRFNCFSWLRGGGGSDWFMRHEKKKKNTCRHKVVCVWVCVSLCLQCTCVFPYIVCVGGLCQEHLLRHRPDGVCVGSLVWRHELYSSSSSSSSSLPAFCLVDLIKRSPVRGPTDVSLLTPEVSGGDKGGHADLWPQL